MQGRDHSPTTPLRAVVHSVVSGLILQRARAGDVGAPEAESSLVVQLADVRSGLPVVDALDRFGLRPSAEVERCRLRPRDVLVTGRGATVHAAVVPPEYAGVIAGPNLFVVRPRSEIDPELLAAFLRHPAVGDTLLRERGSSATRGFTSAQLQQLRLRVPPVEQQADLVHLMQVADRQYALACQAAVARRALAGEVLYDALGPSGQEVSE